MWKPIAPTELKADDEILAGTMRARVIDWRWNIGRAETVVSVRYLSSAPEPYADQRSECVYILGETAQVWRSDRLDDALAETGQPCP